MCADVTEQVNRTKRKWKKSRQEEKFLQLRVDWIMRDVSTDEFHRFAAPAPTSSRIRKARRRFPLWASARNPSCRHERDIDPCGTRHCLPHDPPCSQHQASALLFPPQSVQECTVRRSHHSSPGRSVYRDTRTLQLEHSHFECPYQLCYGGRFG